MVAVNRACRPSPLPGLTPRRVQSRLGPSANAGRNRRGRAQPELGEVSGRGLRTFDSDAARWAWADAYALKRVSGLRIRNPTGEDYCATIEAAAAWWNGRPLRDLVPSVYFRHFRDTSFLAEHDGRLVGLLVGFLSQSERNEAYIRFVCVRPEHRRQGIARVLYEQFFQVANRNGRTCVTCVTTPRNVASIAFHLSLGFSIRQGDAEADGLSLHRDYSGPGGDRVILEKRL